MANWYSGIAPGLGVGKKISQGASNTFYKAGEMSWPGAAFAGAGIGAGIGGINGGMSYDGTVMGGAFKGAALGAAGGSAFKLAGGAYRTGEGKMNSALDWGAFSRGWNAE